MQVIIIARHSCCRTLAAELLLQNSSAIQGFNLNMSNVQSYATRLCGSKMDGQKLKAVSPFCVVVDPPPESCATACSSVKLASSCGKQIALTTAKPTAINGAAPQPNLRDEGTWTTGLLAALLWTLAFNNCCFMFTIYIVIKGSPISAGVRRSLRLV